MGVWTSQDMKLLAVPLRIEAQHKCFPAGVLHLKLQGLFDCSVFLKKTKQDKKNIEYILRELQIFDFGDETIYLRKHTLRE